MGFGRSFSSGRPLPPSERRYRSSRRFPLAAIAQGHGSSWGHGDLGTACWLCLSQGKELKTGRENKPRAPCGSPAGSSKIFHGNWRHSGTELHLRTPCPPSPPCPAPPGCCLVTQGTEALLMMGCRFSPWGRVFMGCRRGDVPEPGVMPSPGSRGPTAIRATTALRVPVPACPPGLYFSWQSPGRNVSRCRAKVEAGIAGIATG